MRKDAIRLCLIRVAIGLSLLASINSASAVIISPIQLDISVRKPITSFKVTNDSTVAIVYQASALSWIQIGGQDTQVDTDDLVITPPIVTIQPKTSQVFRVAMLNPVPNLTELAYRVVLEDISEDIFKNSETGINFRFNHSLPLFYTSKIPVVSLVWSICKSVLIGKSCLRLENKGNSFFKITKFSALSKSKDETVGGVKTILAGNSHEWIYSSMQGTEPTEGFRINSTKEPVNINLKDIAVRN